MADRKRSKKGMSIVEAVVSMAIIVAVTAAFCTVCLVGTKLQAKARSVMRAETAAAEFVSAFTSLYPSYDAEDTESVASLTERYVARLEASLGGDVSSEGNAYSYEGDGISVECEADFESGKAESKGYVSGQSGEVCCYSVDFSEEDSEEGSAG